MLKQKIKQNPKNQVNNEKLIEEIGRITVELEDLRDKNKLLERELLASKAKQAEIKALLDKFQKFREDLVGFIMRY